MREKRETSQDGGSSPELNYLWIIHIDVERLLDKQTLDIVTFTVYKHWIFELSVYRYTDTRYWNFY